MQYYPPTKTSTLCFDSDGNKLDSCTDSAAKPILRESDVTFYGFDSETSLANLQDLPGRFEVRAVPVPQPNTKIASVKFSLSGPDCPSEPDECNAGSTQGQVTTSTCGSGCYSSKDNSPGVELPLFQLNIKDEVVVGDYILKIEILDSAGGLKSFELAIKVTGP